MPSFLFLLLYLSNIKLTEGADILVMLPNCMYSHTHNFMPIFKGLAARGHNVTVVSAFPQKKPVPNLTDIVLPNFTEEILATAPSTNLLELEGLTFRLFGMWMLGLVGTKRALQDETIRRFIQDQDSKFDLIMLETWFLQEAFVAFGHKFKAPVINLMPSYLFPQAAHLTGNYFPCTYVPIAKFGGYSDRMTVLERAQNCLYYIWDVVIGEWFYLRQQENLMRESFQYPGSESLPPLVDMLKNTSLTLTDHNFALGYPMPLHKNVIEFGGLSIKKTEKLPDDLQTYMDKAKDGVIYFSFGSHASVSFMKPENQIALITTLGKLKQKILMKLEDSNRFQNLANENILIKTWFPQPSVIAHPNCKIFITHGGLHGLMEAIQNAIPVIVIPLFGDQGMNAKFVESIGIGYVLEPNSITEANLLYAIDEVLNNSSYREKMRERSEIFKDTPGNTIDNVIYWIEYVIRHKGAPHLRPAVLDLHWYQYLMLDIIVFYLLIILFFIIIFIVLLKILITSIKGICCGGKNYDNNLQEKKSKKE